MTIRQIKRAVAGSLKAAGPGKRKAPQHKAPEPRDTYHHGDLRSALIEAAAAELGENGIDGFTLRGCARRAGVSHAAPAHHFKDVRALLTELAAIGFTHLTELTAGFGEAAPKGTIEHIVEVARGYVTFALRHPHEFRLIFRTDRLDPSHVPYHQAATAAFAVPVAAVGAYYGVADPMADPERAARVLGLWSIVHGFSDLLLSGVFDQKVGDDRQAMVDRVVPTIIHQYFGSGAGAGTPPRKRR